MKKQEKFIDIILMEPELKFNRNKIEKSDPTLTINFLVAILNFSYSYRNYDIKQQYTQYSIQRNYL